MINIHLRSYVKACAFLICISLTLACTSPKNLNKNYTYFQRELDTLTTQLKELSIQPGDLLSIVVYSKSLNQEQAAIFNIPNTGGTTTASGTSGVQGYQVSSGGIIDVPIIGGIKASGLTREQLQNLLVQKLNPYVKDPSVLVRFLQININILGEVRAPGVHSFKTDKITILDAISASGDLTDYGRREDIMVIREESNVRKYYKINLTDGNFFHSPAYQLQPNDIVYVSANNAKLKTLNIDPEAQRKTGLLFTSISALLSVITLVVTLTK
jgi:polysaccharide export outer membrane protein